MTQRSVLQCYCSVIWTVQMKFSTLVQRLELKSFCKHFVAKKSKFFSKSEVLKMSQSQWIHIASTLSQRRETTSPARLILPSRVQRFLSRVRREVRQLLLPGSKVRGRCRIPLQLHPQGYGKMQARGGGVCFSNLDL